LKITVRENGFAPAAVKLHFQPQKHFDMGLLIKYNRNLLKRGYNGPIDFHAPFSLGQVITFSRRKGFAAAGHIADPYFRLTDYTPAIKEGWAIADINFGSETGVNFEAKFEGNARLPNSALDINDAGFRITFENEASYLLMTKGTSIDIIENTAELGSRIMKLYRDGKWNRNWLVLAQIVNAEITTLLISRRRNSVFEIRADGNFTGFSSDLVNADIKFSMVANSSLYTSIVGHQGPFNPLFKLLGVRIRRTRPIGSPFNSINTVDSMSAFTIDQLNEKDSGFEVFFEEFALNETFEMDDDGLV
jgi:hypothetical protein